ncbi:uncharacterized protein LOC143294431 isoform X2 [Babylonia areolata]|uniref:uncharacterized protein LOC143294431 isoform X2 n=1 Tax=Babylonia areolata TaxID=304850 RepID=UPI003FD2856B
MQPKARSAQQAASRAALQSRLAKTQSDAMKEMQAWARRADEPSTCCHVTRMSGQLTENVTEERMLRAKLWELSKERYKNAYEKKLFADRMQRKTRAMLRARANSAATFRTAAHAAKPRPFTTSALTHTHPAFPSSSNSQLRQLSAFKNPNQLGLRRPSTLKTAPQVRPQSMSTKRHARPVSSTKDGEDGDRGGHSLIPARAPDSSPSSDGRLRPRPVHLVKRSPEEAREWVGAVTPQHTDNADSQNTANPLKEVESSWVMSRGRGKVTPAATAISILPPDAPRRGDGRMVLAPLQNAPSTPGAVSKDATRAKPPSAPLSETASRNVQFSKVRGKTSAEAARGTSRGQNQVSSAGPKTSRPNPPGGSTCGALPTRPPSGANASSKPTSASSKRSTPRTPGSASFIGHRRRLLHRYGTRVESKTWDPRYTSLEHSLIPVSHHRQHTDVNAIVQNFEALHMRPKVQKKDMNKTGLKALCYMNDRGFVF